MNQYNNQQCSISRRLPLIERKHKDVKPIRRIRYPETRITDKCSRPDKSRYGLEIYETLAKNKILTKNQIHYYTKLVLYRNSEEDYSKFVKARKDVSPSRLEGYKLDRKIAKLTSVGTIKDMVDPATAKIFKMKDLKDAEFANVTSGADDQPYIDLVAANATNAAWGNEYSESPIINQAYRQKNKARIMSTFKMKAGDYEKRLKSIRGNPSTYLEKELNHTKIITDLEGQKDSLKKEFKEEIEGLKKEVEFFKNHYKQEFKQRIMNPTTVSLVDPSKMTLPETKMDKKRGLDG